MTSQSTARIALRRVVAVGTAVALGASAAVLSASTANAVVNPSSGPAFEDGRYVVVLAEDALATYEGGITGLAPTAPQRGQDLDATSPASRAYTAHLQDRHQDVAASVGATIDVDLTAALNGFVADLTADQAEDLSRHAGVRSVEANEILQVTASPANDYLNLDEPGGLWEQVGGDAGAGVVVGVLDTGIAPENPFFAGAPLGTTPGAEPYLDGQTITYVKGDGSTFTGICQVNPATSSWDASDCSTKIVGARYYVAGFGTSRVGTETQVPGEYVSPRDGDGHGSHTASTAAGNADVAITSVGGADLGTMSGVAPDARIAAYKVCWSGPNPAVRTDDGCASTDLVAAIDQAVKDGVDVINYSIGGGAATSVVAATDVAFLGAAAAGVFVSASAGNSGPGASTLDHASPWYTTVAATTIPNYEATVTFANGSKAAGGSITVPAEGVTGQLVAARAIPAAGQTAANAALCLPGTLDAAAAAGQIVVCERGVNARVEKSEVAAAAGAIGVILVNVTPGSIDLDDHAIPTVHLDAQHLTAVNTAAAARETVTMTQDNTSGVSTPAPVVAGFSSRGPALADGSDVIKPDIAAPGVGIVAAAWQAPDGPARYEFLSGTSMAAPHIAGLAAVYLSEHPLASPAEVKSALMTSAGDTVRANGARETNPFSQGAGIVDSPSFMSPGLYYEAGTEDWYGYLRGLGYGLPSTWVGEAIDPSDLNIPSIGIGSLAGSQTVTRTLTAHAAGTFQVAVEGVAGVQVDVSPSTLTFEAAGDTQTYSVTFTVVSASPDVWATGFLTWANEAHSVRSPIAVRPLALDVPDWAEASGRVGQLEIEGIAGMDGVLTTSTAGFAAYQGLGSATGVTNDEFVYPVTIREGELAHDFVLSGDDRVADLDLYIFRLNSAGQPVEQWVGGTSSADEAVLLEDPQPGNYAALVHVYSVDGGASTPFVLEHAALAPTGGKGRLTASPATQTVSTGDAFTVDVDWRGLGANEQYLGVVLYELGGFTERTYVYAESAPGPTTGRGQLP